MGSDSHSGWQELLSGLHVREITPGAPQLRIDVDSASAAALEEAGLDELLGAAVRESRPLTLVVNDTHRFTDTAGFLRVLLRMLDRSVAKDRVPPLRVLVSAGSHQSTATERSEHEKAMFGPNAHRIAEVVWHDARDRA